MRILLVQADGYTAFPNLALMKISAYHKARGDIVGLHISIPDKIYVSCIFTKNLLQAGGISKLYPEAQVLVGGPALNRYNTLGPEIDNIMPDYDLYGLDYSLGFTSRGCIRSCPFCFVPQLEGDIQEGTSIERFHHPDHRKIILLDNNFLASPTRDRTIDYIIEHDLKVNISQAFDARLVDKAIASRMKEMKLYNWHFTRRKMHFAWDLMAYEEEVRMGLKNIVDVGITKSNVTVYILVGFNTTLEEDLYRIHTVAEMGFDPYVMVYNDRWDRPILQRMERWTNSIIYKKTPFANYDRLSPLEASEAVRVEAAALRRLS